MTDTCTTIDGDLRREAVVPADRPLRDVPPPILLSEGSGGPAGKIPTSRIWYAAPAEGYVGGVAPVRPMEVVKKTE